MGLESSVRAFGLHSDPERECARTVNVERDDGTRAEHRVEGLGERDVQRARGERLDRVLHYHWHRELRAQPVCTRGNGHHFQ